MTKLLNTLVYVQGGEKVVTANNSYGGQTLILGNLTVSYAGQNTTVTGATTIAPNATLSFTATAATGYTLPSEIVVTIDGATATVTTDYTWDSASGVGQILADKIVGNVVITVVGVASGGGYSVTISGMNNVTNYYNVSYSSDNGTTWTPITQAGTLSGQLTQIMFKTEVVFYARGLAIGTTSDGFDILLQNEPSNGQSSNYILASDATYYIYTIQASG